MSEFIFACKNHASFERTVTVRFERDESSERNRRCGPLRQNRSILPSTSVYLPMYTHAAVKYSLEYVNVPLTSPDIEISGQIAFRSTFALNDISRSTVKSVSRMNRLVTGLPRLCKLPGRFEKRITNSMKTFSSYIYIYLFFQQPESNRFESSKIRTFGKHPIGLRVGKFPTLRIFISLTLRYSSSMISFRNE